MKLSKNFTLPLLLLIMLFMTGCASIVSDKIQPLTIQTTCNGESLIGATCELNNSKGNWILTTPGSTTVRKAWGDLSISCKKGGASGVTTLSSSASGSTWGNILVGGGIGAIVDAKTGAGYNYQNSITVRLQGDCPVIEN
jgi:hypothetical protein